jgi:cytidine deaminase
LKYRGDYVYVQVSAQRGKALIALYVVILLYRVCVHRAYRRRLMDGMPPSITQEGGDRVLVDRAKETAKRARAHLSGFRVGAAILSSNGSVYVGCNLEFDNYSNSIHAEEAALSALVSDSKDGKPVAIAVYTTGEEISWPCGMCRQSLYEQGGSELRVIACNDVTSEEMKIGDLLPKAFHL